MATVLTGKVRLSYCKVFQGELDDNGVLKFGTSILIDKKDKETLRKIKEAVDAAKEEGKTKHWNGKIPANLKLPLRDGDDERPEDEAYRGHFFLNANSQKTAPGIAKPVGKDKSGKTIFEDITDETELYSGCYARVSLSFYPFDAKGNRGVAVGLNNIVKVQDGEPLGGTRLSIEDEFGDEEFEIDDAEEDFMS